MKKAMLAALAALLTLGLGAQELERVPFVWKWLSEREVAYSYDGSFTGEADFAVDAKTHRVRSGISAPARYTTFPVQPAEAVNLCYSPDSTMLAFTRGGDLWTVEIATGEERRLTFDGSELILNGYASWVYYEEILGRPSRYRAFWWSPDSRTLAFYRFDNSAVPMFPIYSPKGQDGSLNRTRYPKCGEPNPTVRIGFVPARGGEAVWADFDEGEDQYFGIPFWGADSRAFFVAREPRVQNTLDLYAVSPADGSKRHIYHENYGTWLDWIEGMLFGETGLYMVRDFETLWQQIYFLSYDGQTFRRLTDGPNWRVKLLRVDEKKGEVYFTANRASTVRTGLYKVDAKGSITPLTDAAYTVSGVSFSPDGKYFTCRLSNFSTPDQIWLFETARPQRKPLKVADLAGPDFSLEAFPIPQNITLTTADGLVLPAFIVYPKDFDPSKQYPVHVDIYGGPDSPQVRESWRGKQYGWYAENGIIELTADCRSSGHNGRAGLDQIYRRLDVVEVQDFVEWGRYLQSLPYVRADKICVEGFSFGGTMTALLVMDHSDVFHYGIAGGGVYDWALYDTHYTERFMDTPQNNPDGYAATRALDHAKNYPTRYRDADPSKVAPVMLKLTHGTGDDNVHFQSTLQLVDALQAAGADFELMIYPDGMHGYGGYQGRHFQAANRAFLLKYLKTE